MGGVKCVCLCVGGGVNSALIQCVGGVGVGGGGKFGTYSILHMFLSCNCAKIFYCFSLQHNCEQSLRMVLVSVDG